MELVVLNEANKFKWTLWCLAVCAAGMEASGPRSFTIRRKIQTLRDARGQCRGQEAKETFSAKVLKARCKTLGHTYISAQLLQIR